MRTMVLPLVGHIVITLKAHREGEQYVSECVELGLASCGDTLDEAFQAIQNAVTVYLETLQDEGELERVLAERKITVVAGEPPDNGRAVQVTARPREYVSAETVRVPVPV